MSNRTYQVRVTERLEPGLYEVTLDPLGRHTIAAVPADAEEDL